MDKSILKQKNYATIFIATGIFMGCLRGGLFSSAGQYLTWMSQDLQVPLSKITVYYSIQAIAMIITLPITSMILKKINLKPLLLCTILIQTLGYIGQGFVTNLTGLYFLAAIVSIGTTVNAQIAAPLIINSWFENKSGFILGMVMAISNLMGVFIQPLIGRSILLNGWRFSYIFTGIILGSIAFITTLLFIKKSNKKSLNDLEKADERKTVQTGINMEEAKRSKLLYLAILFVFLICVSSAFSMFVATFTTSLGYDSATAGTVSGIYMAGLCLGSLGFGTLNDKIGGKQSSFINFICGIISFSILILYSDNSFAMVLAGMFLMGIYCSVAGIIVPQVVKDVFGLIEYERIFPAVSLGIAFGAIIGSPLNGMLYDVFQSFKPSMIIGLFLIGVNLLVLNLIYKKKRDFKCINYSKKI